MDLTSSAIKQHLFYELLKGVVHYDSLLTFQHHAVNFSAQSADNITNIHPPKMVPSLGPSLFRCHYHWNWPFISGSHCPIKSNWLLSHKKNEIMTSAATWINLEMITPSEVDQTEKDQMSYDFSYMQHLKKWYKWTYLQNWNRLTDIEDRLMVNRGESWGRDKSGLTNMLLYIKYIK